MIDTTIRRAAKTAVLPAGLVSRRRRGDLVILLYHQLGDGTSEISLPTSAFDRQMAYLSARNESRSLDDALNGDDGGVLVTFDDGTVDFYRDALPVLVRYSIPAILYLATAGVATGAKDSLEWDHLGEAVRTGLVSVGSHTHTHADLSRAGEAEAAEEMERSKELIEDRLGVECRHFAYPWGVASSAAERTARRVFDSAALDAWRTNRHGAIDPHRLARVPILRSDGHLFFRAKVAGRLNAEALVYRALGRGPWRPR